MCYRLTALLPVPLLEKHASIASFNSKNSSSLSEVISCFHVHLQPSTKVGETAQTPGEWDSHSKWPTEGAGGTCQVENIAISILHNSGCADQLALIFWRSGVSVWPRLTTTILLQTSTAYIDIRVCSIMNASENSVLILQDENSVNILQYNLPWYLEACIAQSSVMGGGGGWDGVTWLGFWHFCPMFIARVIK